MKFLKFGLLFCLMSCSGKSTIEAHAEYETRKDLQFMLMCVDAYLSRNGKMPESLFSATLEFENQIPKPWKETNKAIDPWGSPYKMSHTSEDFQIWSFGKNRQDESGKGDDIIVMSGRDQ